MQIMLADTMTKWGWRIRNRKDAIVALMGYEAFYTVAPEFIGEAIDQAAQDRTEYENIEDLGNHILKNYI